MGSSAELGIVLVEDHLAFAQGLALVLNNLGFRVVGTAAEPETGFRLITTLRPDVAVVDLALARENGAALTRRVVAHDSQLSVLIYSGADDHRLIDEALDSGASGFALKSSPPEELARAIRVVAQGGFYIDPDLRSLLPSKADSSGRPGLLSPREREVLSGLAGGLNGEGVADRLSISAETVRTHVRNAMDKLEAHTRTHAVVIAMRRGEIEGS